MGELIFCVIVAALMITANHYPAFKAIYDSFHKWCSKGGNIGLLMCISGFVLVVAGACGNFMNHYDIADICVASYKNKTGANSDVEYLYIGNEHNHLFVIRGTEAAKFFSGRGWIDVLRDIFLIPAKFHAGEAHAGFVLGWDAIYEDISEVISREPDKPVILAGHSMGGAIAMIGAYSITESDYTLQEVVTFGAPRALNTKSLNSHTIELLEIKSTQYEHIADPVPGFLRWTHYKHVNSWFLGGHKRLSWRKRSWSSHWMGEYRDAIKKAPKGADSDKA
jgi:hypothetical protein